MNVSDTVRACAKVNLALEVLDRRPDGYHDIESVAVCVGLWDRLGLDVTEGEPRVVVSVEGEEAPTDRHNTVHRAAAGFLRVTGLSLGVRVRLVKEIPAQSGLGGGSSDAAATLRMLNEIAGNALDADALISIGAEIGSDVPLFLTGGAVLMHGRGEAVTPLHDVPRFWLVIAKPEYGVSTERAYAALDALPDRLYQGAAAEIAAAIHEGDGALMAGMLWNDFEGPVFELYAGLRELKMRLIDLGAAGALLAGSGSAVFGVFTARGPADSAWETLSAEGWRTWRVPSLTREESLAP